MEVSRKRRGLMKAKLAMPLYRATSKNSSNLPYSSNVKPIQSNPPSASVGYLIDQDYINSQSKPKVSFMDARDKIGGHLASDYSSLFTATPGDDSVDAKAASYIFNVQERFRIELMKSERKKYQEVVGNQDTL